MQSSLFLDKNNQQLLWEMIHKSPLIQHVFTPEHASQRQKEQWFMHSIQEIHQRNPTIQSREQLMVLNRSSLQYLLQSLQHLQQQTPVNSNPNNINQQHQQKKVSFHGDMSYDTATSYRQSQDSTYSLTTQYSRNQPAHASRQEDAFQERKRQYDSMLEKRTPPDVQFTEKEDTAISNMDELLEQQRKLRELDLPLNTNVANPLTNVSPIQSTTIQSTTPTNKYNPAAPVLKIHHDQTEEIEPIVLLEPKSEINEDLQILKKEFEDFKQTVLEFIKNFQTLKNDKNDKNNEPSVHNFTDTE